MVENRRRNLMNQRVGSMTFVLLRILTLILSVATCTLITGERQMMRIARSVRSFIAEEEGAALAEYGVLIAFIAIVAIVAVTFFGSKISAKFSSLANSFT
jgi:pilus assembly protein Flp/PilA